MKQHLTLSILLLLLSTLLIGCSSDVRKISLFKKGNESVQLLYNVTDVDGVEQINPLGNGHPTQLSSEQVEIFLNEVLLQKYAFFTWSEPQPLFSTEEVKKLAPRLAEAFAKATADQWIYFSITAEKPGLISDSLRMTDGICYFREGQFNLVLGNINFDLHNSQEQRSLADPREQNADKFYRIVFGAEKGYEKPPIVPDHQWLAEEQMQWLVFDVDAFLSSRPLEKETTSPNPLSKGAFKERLQKLKELHEQELITDQEYESKRKTILEEL